MTGRKGRVVTTEEGNVEYQTRAESDVPVELLNMTEKQVRRAVLGVNFLHALSCRKRYFVLRLKATSFRTPPYFTRSSQQALS